MVGQRVTGLLQVPDRLGNRPIPTLLATSMSITLGALPIFLVGAMAVFIRPELEFGESALGALATLYYLTSALTTVPGGRLAERLGGPRTMAVAASLSTVVFLGISTLARSWVTLAAFLVVAGVANGIAFPGSNLAFARGFPPSRQGIGYAVKQSAGPYATMLAGAAVPLIGLTVGWRWAFALAALLALPIMAGRRISQPVPHHARSTAGWVPRRPVWILALSAFFAVNASAALGAFYVESAVSKGIGAGTAGALLSVGSGFGILCRIGWGWIADRRPRIHFGLLTAILSAGAFSIWMLGFSESGPALAAVTLMAFGTGWAWPSLLNFAVLSRTPGAEGTASGIIGTGQYGGGILGPLMFGVLVERASYRVAWSVAGVMLGLAATCAFVGGRVLVRAVSERMVT